MCTKTKCCSGSRPCNEICGSQCVLTKDCPAERGAGLKAAPPRFHLERVDCAHDCAYGWCAYCGRAYCGRVSLPHYSPNERAASKDLFAFSAMTFTLQRSGGVCTNIKQYYAKTQCLYCIE